MNSPEKGRRRFFGRLTKIAAGMGGLIAASVVPELRAQTRSTASTNVATSVSSTALSTASENQLYTQALSDPDVALMLSGLGEIGRLDPPNRTHDIVLDAGNRALSVTLPVTSYASGLPIAYVVFGTGTCTGSDGATAVMPLRGMVTRSGRVLVAGGGRVADHPRADWNETYFALFFPDQYHARRTSAAPSPAAPSRTSGGLWERKFLRNARVAANDKRGYCMQQCKLTWDQCLNAAVVTGMSGLLVGFWCGLCLAAAGGLIVITAGVAAPAITICATPCAIAAGAIIATHIIVSRCNSTLDACIELCQSIPIGTPV